MATSVVHVSADPKGKGNSKSSGEPLRSIARKDSRITFLRCSIWDLSIPEVMAVLINFFLNKHELYCSFIKWDRVSSPGLRSWILLLLSFIFLNLERIVENLIPSGVSSFLLFYLLIHPGKCEDTGPLNLFSLPFLFFPLGLGDWRG